MSSIDGRGRLARRAFLGGLALGAGGLAARAAEPLAARMPEAMRTLGGVDLPYGQPSSHEQQVRRMESNVSGFSAWRTPLQTQRGIITPSGLHFAVHHNGLPDIAPEQHVLMVHGMVHKPLRFDLQRLMRYPIVSRVHFLECAGNSAANALSPLPVKQTLGEIAGEVSCSE